MVFTFALMCVTFPLTSDLIPLTRLRELCGTAKAVSLWF